MVKSSTVSEICAIDGELVICVELGFDSIVACPWIAGATFKDEHAMIDGRTVEGTEGVNLRRRRIFISC